MASSPKPGKYPARPERETVIIDAAKPTASRDDTSRDRPEHVLDALGEPVVVTDLGGIVIYWNASCERRFGLPPAEAVGRNVHEVIAGEAGTAGLTPQLAAGQRWSGEAEARDRDGHGGTVIVSATPLVDGSGEVVGTVRILTDAGRLQAQIDDYDRREQLRLGFLRATSHELRSPLTAISGFAQTLRAHDHRLEPAQRTTLVERIGTNASRLVRLVEDLLDVDRLTSGRATVTRSPERIDELVRGVVDEVDLSGRTLEAELQPVTATVDGRKIERVVANLLTNAVRHTPEGTVVLVRLAAVDDEVVLQVEDSGPGMDPDLIERVFDPFVQGSQSATGVGPGTGLGLAIARELVALHGGRISAQNRPAGGARFEVRLPRQ